MWFGCVGAKNHQINHGRGLFLAPSGALRFSLCFALLLGRRSRGGAATGSGAVSVLAAVVGHIPAAPFEADGRCGQQTFEMASTFGTLGQFRVREALYNFKSAMAFLAPVFVQGHKPSVIDLVFGAGGI